MSRSSSPIRETWRHRSHSTVNVPRSAIGLSEVARTLSDSGRAPEYSARLPTGRTTAAPDVSVGPPLASAVDGTQNNARFPSGSTGLSRSRSATDHIASMALRTAVASVR
jgi:hypothetical protein